MDSWTDLCRCCLSQDSKVSFLDEDLKVREKFLQITTIEVHKDDGLPQKLCGDCYSIMNSAFQFRQQCIKMESELKMQFESLMKQLKKSEASKPRSETEEDSQEPTEISDDPITQLKAIIKEEHNGDGDDDYYYVLVIDDPKDKAAEALTPEKLLKEMKCDFPVDKIKEENQNTEENVEIPQPIEDSQEQTERYENYDAYLNTKVPINVPATILENEEVSQENEGEEYNNGMDIEETQDSTSQDHGLPQTEDSQESQDQITATPGEDNEIDAKNSIIKILTTAADGTIVLKSEDGIQYLTGSQFIANDNEEDGDPLHGEEVIFCEGDESQFKILNCDGSELVIEYADGNQIATVMQQEDGTFLCNCGEQFEDLAEYEKHQLNHNPAGEHICNLCGKGFESEEVLTGHMVLHSVTGVLVSCPFCDQLIRRNSLTQHIKYSHVNTKPQCGVCSKTFANPNNLKRHMMIHTGVREFECDICFKRFHQKITMQTHRLTHINVNHLSCVECDQTFESKLALQQHKESNECTKSKVQKVKEKLMKTVKHQVTTSLGKLLGYACSLCKKMFSLESALEQHIESTHMVDPSELLCTECGEVLPSKKDMQSHILTHKNYRQRNLKRFECSICGKGCSSQAMLVMHERVHTNERPYPCGLCSLRFKTKTHLRTHQLTHTREKKFGCSVCMKFFALKGNLVVHLRTHTGERPYVCSLCGESFIDSKYLKKHKLKKHAIDNVPWNQY